MCRGRTIIVRPTWVVKGCNYNAHVASPHPEIPTCQTVFCMMTRHKINKCIPDHLPETLRTKWSTSDSHMSTRCQGVVSILSLYAYQEIRELAKCRGEKCTLQVEGNTANMSVCTVFKVQYVVSRVGRRLHRTAPQSSWSAVLRLRWSLSIWGICSGSAGRWAIEQQ